MPESPSPSTELRTLEEKRTAGGLTPAEERRLGELRARSAPAAPRGFDIGAAAAAVREAAGLASAPAAVVLDTGALGPSTPPLPVAPRAPESLPPLPPEALAPLPGAEAFPPEGFDLAPPPMPAAHEEIGQAGYDVVPAFETPGSEPAPAPGAPDWSSWVETAATTAPATPPGGLPLEGEPGAETQAWEASAENRPDPGQPQGWDPNAQAQWDPNGPAQADAGQPQTWDPNAQAQWDPNQPQTWDPNAQAQWDPNQPQTWDPNAQAQWDPNQPQTWDPNAQAQWDPNAPAQADAGQPQTWDPGTQPPAEPGAEGGPASTQVWAPAAEAQAEPAAEEAWDPNRTVRWDPAAGADASAAGWGDGPAEEAPSPPVAPEPPRKRRQTASWDLSGTSTGGDSAAAQTPPPDPVVPDEGDPGATAVWSVSQVLRSRPPAEAGASPGFSADEDVEAVVLDEIQLESGGSFGTPTPPGSFRPPAAPPPEPAVASEEAPAEVADDQILEVGAEVQELSGDDLPTVEAVDEVLPDAEEPASTPPLDLRAPTSVPAAAPEPGLDLFGSLSLEPEGHGAPRPAPAAATPSEELLAGLEALDRGAPAAEPPPGPAPAPAPAGDLLADLEPAAEPRFEEAAPLAFAAELPPDPEPVSAPPVVPPPVVPPAAVAVAVAVAPSAVVPPPPAVAPPKPGYAPLPPAAEPPPPPGDPISLDALSIDEGPVEEPPARPLPPPEAGSRVIPGLHRVVVHTVEGQVKRGQLHDPDLSADLLALLPQAGAAAELLPADRVRAIFFMLGAQETAPAPSGLKVRVTFKDGRQVAGFSADYDPESSGFFMVPADTRTNTARIWVYRKAVRQVSVS